MKIAYTIGIVAILILSGCKPTLKGNLAEPDSAGIPMGIFWKLDRLGDQNITVPTINDNEIGFTLTPDNTISGFAGCNQFSGKFEYGPNNAIQFSPMMATKMFCEDMQSTERGFFMVFMEVSTYRVSDGRLEFLAEDGTPLAIFHKSIDRPVTITDTYWRLKTLKGQPVEMAKNQTRETFFRLKSEDNSVTGFAGCNTLFGSYALDPGNKIHFSHIAATLMACLDGDIRETEFLQVFEHADNYSLIDGELTLKNGQNTLAVFEAVYFE